MKLELNTTDIEEYAVSAVEREIQKYPDCLKAFISKNDKTPMWDGEIAIYNSHKKRNEDWEYKLDIQVKGTQVEAFSTGNIKFPIKVSILKNYQKTGSGTLFFVVEIIDSTETKIYYKNLLPVDIKEILDKTNTKQQSVSITLKPVIPKTPSSMRNICLNFAKNSQLQQGKIIKNITELNNIKTIEIPFILDSGEKYEDFLFSENVDIYSYATLNDGQKFVLPKLNEICGFEEMSVSVKVNSKEYYKKITFIKNKDKNNVIIGNSLIFYLNTNQMAFKLKGTLYERIHDINFLFDTINNNGFYINDLSFVGINTNCFKKDFMIYLQEELIKLKNLKSLFEKFNINFNIDLSLLKEEDWKNIGIFKLINSGKYLKPDSDLSLYNITIANYKIIFLTIKNLNSFDTYNYFSNLNGLVKVFFFDSNNKEIPMSPYVNLTENDLLTASNIDTDIIKQSFSNLDGNDPMSCEYIRSFVLTLIKAYDNNNTRKDIIELAYDLNTIINVEETRDIDKINTFQVLKRIRCLSESEIEELYYIKENNNNTAIQVAISILLENKSDFNRYFNKLEKDEQENLKQYPIYTLNKF